MSEKSEGYMIREKIVAVIKIVVFLGIGAFLFREIQDIVTPKYTGNNFEQFYSMEKDSVDAVFLGTSHMGRGYSPMEVYEKYGIVTYNFGTDLQPIPVSYYLTREILDYQTPKVIVFDASSLYLDIGADAVHWRYTMDSMDYSGNHTEMAKDFGKRFEKETELGAVFPIVRYHTRWNELAEENFDSGVEEYCAFGQELTDTVIAPPIDETAMNELTYAEDEYYEVTETAEGSLEVKTETLEHQYSVEANEENLDYLEKMKEACEEAGVDFLVTKIPSVQYPEGYSSSWTRQRSDMTRQICSEMGIEFLDLLYDENGYMVDYQTDFQDGGYHLSFRGAQKVSDFFGSYLTERYSLTQKRNAQFEEKRLLFEEEREKILLCTELDFFTYMDRVQSYRNKGESILISGSADMLSRLSPDCQGKLWNLGLQTDFLKYGQGGYVAYIQGKNILYEGYSNLTVDYEHGSSKEDTIYLEATGREGSWYTTVTFPFAEEDSSEEDEVNYTRYDSSLTIVVYNEEEEEILDGAYFMLNEDGTVFRVW